MNTCIFNNKPIAYTRSGEGPCIALVHGFPMDSRVWQNLITGLEGRFTVVALDLPGFGQSAQLDSTHSMPLMAAAIKAVLDKENIRELVLAGHSMGGYVSLAFAAVYPKMLKGLAMIHSRATGDDEKGKEGRNLAIEKVKSDKNAFLENFVPPLFDPEFAANSPDVVADCLSLTKDQTKEAIVAALAGMRDRTGSLEVLMQLQIPVLFVLGKNDSLMPPASIMAQASLAAHAELLLLDKVGHMGFYENPKVILGVLGGFAERCHQKT